MSNLQRNLTNWLNSIKNSISIEKYNDIYKDILEIKE